MKGARHSARPTRISAQGDLAPTSTCLSSGCCVQAQQVQSKQIAQMTEVTRKLQHQQQQTTAELTMAMQTSHEQQETWNRIFT